MITTETIFIVLFAACIHAIWNFAVKSIGGGRSFVWLGAALISVWMLPLLAVWMWLYPPIWGWQMGLGLLVSSLSHFVYFLVLQRGYEVADLSVVYPIARGSAPMLASLAAVLCLGEKLNQTAALGLLLVAGGIIFIATPKRTIDKHTLRLGIQYGLGIGALIAFYTILDTWLVRSLAVAPLLIEVVSHPFRVALLMPHALRNQAEIKAIWHAHTRKILFFVFLSPTAFVLILYALKTAPVHFVAPTRELSIVIGVLLGGRLLAEEHMQRRLVGACLMLAGVAILAMSRG